MERLFILIIFALFQVGLCGQSHKDSLNKIYKSPKAVSGKIIIRDIFKSDPNITKLTVEANSHRNKKYSIELKDHLIFRFDSLDFVGWTITVYNKFNNLSTQLYISGITKDTLVEIVFPAPCKYDSSFVSKRCPKCKKDNMVIPILYGYVRKSSYKDNLKKYKIGGCIVSDCQPRYYCKRDDLDF
jgi:hypothetical protein